LNPALFRETNDGQHILFGFRAADDVVADRLRRMRAFVLRDTLKGVK